MLVRLAIFCLLSTGCLVAEPSPTTFTFESTNPARAALEESEKQHISEKISNFFKKYAITPDTIAWQKNGENHELVVKIPALSELNRSSLVEKIEKNFESPSIKLGLHHVVTEGHFAKDEKQITLPIEHKDDEGNVTTEMLALKKESFIDESHVIRAQELVGPYAGRITVELNEKGTIRMRKETQKIRLGVDRVAIVLNGKIMSAPVVQSILGANFEISGLDSIEEARKLAIALVSPERNALKIKSINPPLAK